MRRCGGAVRLIAPAAHCHSPAPLCQVSVPVPVPVPNPRVVYAHSVYTYPGRSLAVSDDGVVVVASDRDLWTKYVVPTGSEIVRCG